MGSTASTPAGGNTTSNATQVSTWANRPAVNTLTPYTDRVFITDVGMGGSEWYSDGTRYRAVGGQVVLFSGISGAVTNVNTVGKLINTRILAGILKAGDELNVRTFIKKTGTVGGHGYDIRISNADDTSTSSNTTSLNNVLSALPAANTGASLNHEVKIASNTDVLFCAAGGAASGFGSGSTAHLQTASSGTFVTNDVYVGIRVNQVNAADSINLINLTITLNTCG